MANNSIALFVIIGLSLTFLVQSLFAQSLYKWVDENGNVTYQDSPPPSNVNYEEQEYANTDSDSADPAGLSEYGSNEPNLNDIIEQHPVSFYAIENCDACDLVRLFLDNNSVPYTEKNIQSNLNLQEELLTRTGQLQVPTVTVGDKIVDGYSKSALNEALSEKGYPLGGAALDQTNQSGDTSDQGISNNELDNLTNVFDEADAQLDAAESEDGFDEDSVIEIQSE